MKFIQRYQNGKIYRLATGEYVLMIDGDNFYGSSITETLEQYSASESKPIKKKKKS